MHNVGMIYGYARVSTDAQDLTGKLAHHRPACSTQGGCEKVFREKITGATADRPQLRKLMAALAHGDGLWCKWRGPIGYADLLNGLRSAMGKLKIVEELFKGRHFDQGIVILCVRWYLRFKLSLRDLVELIAERGLPAGMRAHRTDCAFGSSLPLSLLDENELSYIPRCTSLYMGEKHSIRVSMRGRVALIARATGQDGAYLVDFLLRRCYAHRGKRRSSFFG